MDYSNNKLDTAESSKNLIDNAGEMSFETTEVSLNNNKKENSEIFDESMVCDDGNCIDNDVDVRKDENHQYITVELPPVAVAEEIPPKSDTMFPPNMSPKSKKRKLPRFDELLENLHFKVLIVKFTKLLHFLESNNKELSFPFILKDYEEFFEMIVQDINILKSKSLDANYRDICDKIIAAASGHLLTCVYEYRQAFQEIVMVIKKEHNDMMDQSENGMPSFSCTTESVMASSQTSSEVESNEVLSRSPSPSSISSGFKVHCLRTTLAFVKNANTKTTEFPELNLEQAQFMQLLLESVIAFTKFDSNLEIKELYRALWEAVRIYSLKYEFRIKCVDSCGGKKSLVFEKLPKQKPSATAVDSKKIMNRKTDVLKTKASNPEALNPEASNKEATKTEAPMPKGLKPAALKADSVEASKSEAPKPEASIPEAPNPVASKAEAPEASKSEVLKPDASKLKALNPEASNKEATKTEAPLPEGLKPKAAKTDAVKASKSEAPKPEASKPEAPKPVASKTEDPEASKSEVPKPEALKPKASKPDAPYASKSGVSNPEVPKPEVSNSKPWFPMPEIPKSIPYVNQNPIRITKRMLRTRLKMENENLFIKRLPAKFISDTLNTIHEFLLDEERFKLVFVPKTHCEQDFYKKCLSWCRTTFVVSKFGDEFQKMHHQISSLLCRVNCTVTKGSASKINETTGIKEVTYIKELKNVPIMSIPDTAQSTPRKMKVNLQNALQLAETDNIKLASVVDLNQSLRNKKKNKKLKKAKLKAINSAGASKGASVKQINQAKTWTDCSISTCRSRGTSKDRSKNAVQAQHVAKRALNEMNQSAKNPFRETSLSRRDEETTRKDQLIEALSVPVQSDKAMRMMRGMGWSGGALGARGDGITEPLMPALSRAKGAGLGHSRNTQSEIFAKNSKAPSFVSENSKATTNMDNDFIVQKTKQLLVENPTFDSIVKVVKPQKPKESNVELPTQTISNVELSKPTKSTVDQKVELPRQTKPLPTQTKTTVELPKPIKADVEPPAPRKSNAKQQIKPLPTLTKFSIELQKPENSDLKFPLPFRQEILHSILELLDSDATSKTLIYEKKICKKARNFVKNASKVLKGSINYGIFQKEEHDICRKIQDKYQKMPQVIFEALISNDLKSVQLTKKVLTEFETPKQEQELPIITQLSPNVNTEMISEENLHSYIISSGTHIESQKAYDALKFKVLFLLNILSFVKSSNEEVEVTFNKVLNVKQKTYIQNVVDEVNMRIKFGSSPAEAKLCGEIKNHVKDAFLGSMFNHQYTVVTLNKYFRFKRLNRPDNVVKRTCQTTVDLDAFSSETCSKSKLNTNEPTDKENNNKVTGNSYKDAENNNQAKNNNNVAENNSKVAEINNKIAENNSKVAENNNKIAENNSKVAENNNKIAGNNSKVDDYNNAYVAFENNAVALPEGNELEPYESDNSSVEEYNITNCTVPKLLPGEDGVNMSNFLYLYDEEKLNTADVKHNSNIDNDSASKNNSNVTENINKNNIGNGNVFIDNNDNQNIDMKRDRGNTKNTEKEKNIVSTEMAEYVIYVGYTEEVVNTEEMTVHINKEKEVNITENKKDGEEIDQPIKHSDIVVANDVVEIVNQHKEIGIDNIQKMIDDVLSNTEDTIDQNVIVVKDSDPNDCIENIVKDEINIDDNPSKNYEDTKEDTDVIMIDIDQEPMEVISITEELIEVIDKEDSVKVINKEKSVELINQGESIEEINKEESPQDVEVTKMEEENSINPINAQIVKGDLGVKTNISSKEKLVLSEHIWDTHSVGLSSVQTVGTTDVPNLHINKDTEIKNVRIVHTNHPITKLTNEEVKEIQRYISNSIVQTTQLPLLKCHGVQNGALFYSCHNKKTYDWLQNIISVASYVKVLNTEVTKMALKFYCFCDFDTKNLFKMIELYNQELCTKDWVVEKTEKDGDYVILIVKMDKFSIKLIQELELALFAGADKVHFSLIWE